MTILLCFAIDCHLSMLGSFMSFIILIDASLNTVAV